MRTGIIFAVIVFIGLIIAVSAESSVVTWYNTTTTTTYVNQSTITYAGTNTETQPTNHTLCDNPDVINVKCYGAIGDGIHDDTQAAVSAYNTAAEANNISGHPRHAILYFPPGIYQIAVNNLVVRHELTIQGVRNPASGRKGIDDYMAGTVIRAIGSNGVLWNISAAGVTFKDINIIDTTNSNIGMKLGSMSVFTGGELKNNRIVGFSKGLDVQSMNDVLVEGNGFESNSYDIFVDTKDTGFRFVRFIGNVFSGASGSMIYFATNSRSRQITFVGNEFLDNTKQIALSSVSTSNVIIDGLVINGNQFYYLDSNDVPLQATAISFDDMTSSYITNTVISGNRFRGAGLKLTNSVKQISIIGNAFSDQTSMSPVYLISTRNVTIIGNTFENTASPIYRIGDGNTRIIGNPGVYDV